MKRFNIKFLATGLFALLMASCNKSYLEKFPASSIELSQSFQTVRDAKTWNNGLYAGLRGRVYGEYMFIQDIQADQLNATVDYGNNYGSNQRWQDLLATDYSLANVWTGYYRGITDANIMIEGFEKITPGSTAETTELNRYKGDAYLVRAYYYHQLVKRFAKPYEAATASTTLGVPLITKYDINAQPPRATLKAVYDQIISDILQAKTLLSGVVGSQGATTFTRDAALAIEARVKLDMQDWAGAKAAADAVIATGLYPLITTQAGFTDYWQKDTKQESILQLSVNPNAGESLPVTNSIYLLRNNTTTRFQPYFIPSQWVIDKYAATDIRKAAYFASLPVTLQGVQKNLTLVNKYPGNPALFTTANTNYQHMPKVLRIAEMYLISAEAGARGTADADGLAKLNALRVARGLLPLLGLADDPLFAEVKEERFRELAFEGQRLFDLKRWHEGFTRSNPQDPALLQAGAGFTTLSIPADHPKFVWGIPSNDISINKSLQQNEGW